MPNTYKVRDFRFKMPQKNIGRFFLVTSFLFAAVWCFPSGHDEKLPVFGKDTVLVWEIPLKDFTTVFIVRLARYSPDLLMEWEDEKSQGTVFIPRQEIMKARGYVNTKLFKPGRDTQAENETTVWLSRQTFRDLKDDKEVKLKIDRVQSRMTYMGEEEFTVEINGSPVVLPVIKVQDSRKAEMWFLDREDNPLLVQYRIRHYSKKLISITTDRKNTLRWLKGQKLKRMLQD